MFILSLLTLAGIACAQETNLARLDGAVCLADSTHRDRWGLDGYHPALAIDGDTDGAGGGSRTASWASDNFEVTHSLALVFPRRVSVRSLRIHWASPGGSPLTSGKLVVSGLVDGAWQQTAEWASEAAEPASTVFEGPAVTVDAIRVSQPPESAAAGADRRLWIAEIQALGTPVEPEVAVDVQAVSDRVAAELGGLRHREDADRVAQCLATVMQKPKERGFMAIIDRTDMERGRRNVQTRPWAAHFRDGVVRDADWWVGKGDEYIYDLLPEGNPRAICPNFERGCPIHGGARQTFRATLEKPYVWRCSKGGEDWYDGCTVTNPGTGEQVTVHDDSNGFLAPEGFPHAGRRYYFVAAYRYFVLGKLFSSPYEPDGGSEYQGGTPVMQLALAYALTGEAKYAHTAAVMLLRLADLYPTYDGTIEGPSQRQDGYIGQTFERFLVQNLILACDLIWDEVEGDEALLALFAARGLADANGDGALTGKDLTCHLQRNLLGYIYEYLHRLMPYLDGDFLMYEMTALAALSNCLGNADLAAETLESDLGLRVLLTNSWFRDGKFIYDSTGYNRGNALTPLLIAEWMHGLQAPPRFAEPLDLYHHPDYRMSMLYDFLRHVDCDGRVPQIGDTGGSRGLSLRTEPAYGVEIERAFARLPEDREFYASQLLAASGGDLESFRDGRADWWTVFHAEEPLTAGDAARHVPESHLFDDSGIAILRAGRDASTRQHVPLTFSRGSYGHGHPDKLAINFFRYGHDFSADLGYPTTWTDLKYGGWETNTASHCLVMLDERGQSGYVTGKLGFFERSPVCDVVEASCEPAYPQASVYRRTVALVKDAAGEPLYTADLFRVAGASTRDYLFHSLGSPEDMTVTLEDAAPWTAQPQGSLAGEGVPPMSKGGYAFLFDLQRAHTDGGLTARWEPSTGTSQPDRYLLTRREFANADVTFTLTRTGHPSGDRERAVFVFATAPGNVGHRRVIMLPVDWFPVGEPVKVRVEVRGGTATMSIGGKPAGHVDVAGAPAESGSIGFLHYYNYDWEYRDLVIAPEGEEPISVDLSGPLSPEFWSRIEPTYSAGDGVLRATDSSSETFYLHAAGQPGREVIRAKAEGYGLRGQSPFEGHIILRERAEKPELGSVFVTALEAVRGEARVKSVARLPVEPQTGASVEGCDAVAARIVVNDGGRERVDYILSCLDPTVARTVSMDDVRIRFQGTFGMVSTFDGRPSRMLLVGGPLLAFGDQILRGPGTVEGAVSMVNMDDQSLTLTLDPDSRGLDETFVGEKLIVQDPDYICPCVYTITSASPAPEGKWKLGVSMPFGVAWGTVASVDAAAGSFASRPPLMKLRVNPGMFDGKLVRALPDGEPHRLTTATEQSLCLADPEALAGFAPGKEFQVVDVGSGDRIHIVSRAYWAAQ